MRVPHALKRENAGLSRSFVQAASNAVCLGFEMLRMTARCCGEDELSGCSSGPRAGHRLRGLRPSLANIGQELFAM
jgi:hypothetical protein